MFESVEAKRAQLDRHRPFDDSMLARLDAVFEPLFIYGSNALEGNTLSLGDTIYVIREGRLPGGKREEEYLEVKGQQAAYAYLRQAVAGGFELTEKLVREFHQLLTDKLDPEKYLPGAYKNRDNLVALPDGTLFPYVSHVEVPAAVRDLVAWFRGDGQTLHPVERAAALHYRFILIHPFLDGNGRTARLLTNFALLTSGHSMALFRADERRRVYLDALRAADTSVPIQDLRPDQPQLNLFPFVSYVEQELLWSYDQALDVVEGRMVVTTEDLVRRFSGLEQRGLAAAGILTDESSRLAHSAQLVERLTHIVASKLEEIAAAVGKTWAELEIRYYSRTGGARDILEGSQYDPVVNFPPRLEVLGWGAASIRGHAGLVGLRIQRKAGGLLQVDLPTNVCEFVIHSEPHSLKLGSYRTPAMSGEHQIDSASVKLPLDPELWRSSEIDRFLAQEIDLFREATEAAIRARNPGP